MNRPRPDYGNGQTCPDNPEHGHLYALTRGEWCPVTATYPHVDALRRGADAQTAPPASGTGSTAEGITALDVGGT